MQNPGSIEELKQLALKDPKLQKVTKESIIELIMSESERNIDDKLSDILKEMKEIRAENNTIQ